jgi:hypothetical protein
VVVVEYDFYFRGDTGEASPVGKIVEGRGVTFYQVYRFPEKAR